MSTGFLNVGKVAALCAVLVLPACAMGGSASPMPDGTNTGLHTLSGGAAGGGGGAAGGGGGAAGGGGAVAGGGAAGGVPAIPPGPTVDGASWFVTASTTHVATAIDFDALPNSIQGGVSIGATTGSSQVFAFNTSKKTALNVSSVTLTGPNASDFILDPTFLKAALTNTIPANKGQAAVITLAFKPSAEGPRTATLVIVSNAGTASISLSGAGLPNEPILNPPSSSLAFFVGGAPANYQLENIGGLGLELISFTFTGPNAADFAIFGTNSGQSNCFPGVLLGPHSYCFTAFGPIDGTPAGATATLKITTNDPLHPVTKIQLSVTN